MVSPACSSESVPDATHLMETKAQTASQEKPVDEAAADAAEWERIERKLETENRDTAWALKQEKAIQETFRTLDATNGATLEVRCFSQTCSTRFDWSALKLSSAEVEKRSMALLHESHKALNCARSLRTGEDQSTLLVFEC